LDWLSFKSEWFGRLIQPAPLQLIKNGRNMRLELILRDELRMQLREQGLEDISKAKNAYIESDGRISVIQRKQRQHEKVERKEI